jgi:Fe2+ or Zn2+ uptake regulation protein
MKDQDKKIRELFRANGLRVTLLRIQVYRSIIELSGGEFCIQDICEKLNAQDIFLNHASVSRVIKQFEESGLILKNKGGAFHSFSAEIIPGLMDVELKQA